MITMLAPWFSLEPVFDDMKSIFTSSDCVAAVVDKICIGKFVVVSESKIEFDEEKRGGGGVDVVVCTDDNCVEIAEEEEEKNWVLSGNEFWNFVDWGVVVSILLFIGWVVVNGVVEKSWVEISVSEFSLLFIIFVVDCIIGDDDS